MAKPDMEITCKKKVKLTNIDIDIHNYEFDKFRLQNLTKINKFDINFNKKELIDYKTKLIASSINPNKYILVLKTTSTAFDEYIGNPNNNLFAKDYINMGCTYNDDTKTLINYSPRTRFIFYNNGNLVYCTKNNNISTHNTTSNTTNLLSPYHKKFITHKSFINIVKNINKSEYNILPDIAKLYNVKGDNSEKIAKLINFIMPQDSSHMLQFLMRKLFDNKYELSNILSLRIYKINTKYIIIKKYIINGFEPVNNTLPSFNDRLQVTYIIDKSNPNVFIKLDIVDIDNIIKNYNPLDKQTTSELEKAFLNNSSNKVVPLYILNDIVPNKINFIYINSTEPFVNNSTLQ